MRRNRDVEGDGVQAADSARANDRVPPSGNPRRSPNYTPALSYEPSN